MISDTEQVARALFSPKMIIDGEIQPEAFRLRPTIKEEYISVMRIGIDSWKEDILKIPQRKNRILYGYAEMNVAEIRSINLEDVKYDVKENNSSVVCVFLAVKRERARISCSSPFKESW